MPHDSALQIRHCLNLVLPILVLNFIGESLIFAMGSNILSEE